MKLLSWANCLDIQAMAVFYRIDELKSEQPIPIPIDQVRRDGRTYLLKGGVSATRPDQKASHRTVPQCTRRFEKEGVYRMDCVLDILEIFPGAPCYTCVRCRGAKCKDQTRLSQQAMVLRQLLWPFAWAKVSLGLGTPHGFRRLTLKSDTRCQYRTWSQYASKSTRM